jgi:hypothetical protein
MYEANSLRNSFSADPGPQKYKAEWTFNTGAPTGSPAIDAQGNIYVADAGGILYAIRPNGYLKWSFNFHTAGNPSTPAIDEAGTIYLGTANDRFYAISSAGHYEWSFKTGSGIYSSPAIARNGVIYFGSTDGYLYTRNPSGTLNWKFYTGAPVNSSPAIGPSGDIYFGNDDGYLFSLSPAGILQWKDADEGGTNGPSIGPGGTIYSMANLTLFAIRPNGALLWNYTGAYESEGLFSPGNVAINPHSGVVYVPNEYDGNDVDAISASGTYKWQYDMDSQYGWNGVIEGSDGKLYVGLDDPPPLSDSGFCTLYAFTASGAGSWCTFPGYFPGATGAIGAHNTLYTPFADSLLAIT